MPATTLPTATEIFCGQICNEFGTEKLNWFLQEFATALSGRTVAARNRAASTAGELVFNSRHQGMLLLQRMRKRSTGHVSMHGSGTTAHQILSRRCA